MRAFPLLLALSLALLNNLLAQQSPVYTGTRVRISAPSEGYPRLIGTVSGYDSETLAIRPDHEDASVTVSLTSVTEIQRSYGRRTKFREGALIGLLLGGAAGAVVGATTYEECVSHSFFGCMFEPGSQTGAAILGGFVGSLVGIGLGAGIGGVIETDRWEEVPLDQLHVSFASQRDGRFAVGVSLRF